MRYIRSIDDISEEDIVLAGGKAVSLAVLRRNRFPVPPGFVILSQAHRAFSEKDEFLEEFKNQVLQNVKKFRDALFAVRSSASVEDSPSSSWAGQLESFLNIGREGVFDAIKKCWSSISSPRATAYAKHMGLGEDDVQMAVIVQKMVPARAAGVCFTMHPVLNDDNFMSIEFVRGFGEPLVQGRVAGDVYVVDKNKMTIIEKNVSSNELTDEHVLNLSHICRDIENIYGKPQDIEWAFDGKEFFIVQSRPITS